MVLITIIISTTIIIVITKSSSGPEIVVGRRENGSRNKSADFVRIVFVSPPVSILHFFNSFIYPPTSNGCKSERSEESIQAWFTIPNHCIYKKRIRTWDTVQENFLSVRILALEYSAYPCIHIFRIRIIIKLLKH